MSLKSRREYLGTMCQRYHKTSSRSERSRIIDEVVSVLGYHRTATLRKLPPVSLNAIYRSLDLLCYNKELLEGKLFYQNRSLFNMQVDVVFYDVTTFSFESVKADSYLKDIGGKDLDWVLDEEAIAKDAQFDGYYGIQTNEKELKITDVLDAYHTLWKIEESFRTMKSTLEVQPVFHWTETPIKGHFVLCFLAFLLERTLEFKLKEFKAEASPEKIREALNSLNFAEVEIEGKQYYIKTKGTELSSKILRQLKISPPKNITPVEELTV